MNNNEESTKSITRRRSRQSDVHGNSYDGSRGDSEYIPTLKTRTMNEKQDKDNNTDVSNMGDIWYN